MSQSVAWLSMFFCLILLMGLMTKSVAASAFGARYCDNPEFHCIKIQRGDTWETLWPSYRERDVVKRLNRMNIPLRAGMLIAVPNDLAYVEANDIAPFARQIVPPGEKLLIFAQKHLAWVAYDAQGRLLRWGPASGGQGYCADVGRSCRTVTGEFRIQHKRGAYCKSSKYPLGRGGAPMPHCMFFHGGYAFHGSPEVPGYHASHGCVRMFNQDAQWLNQEFIEVPRGGASGTRVIIESL
ncbi:MAG: L,D-transpeptidase [Gammaproteobacteria bacterium]